MVDTFIKLRDFHNDRNNITINTHQISYMIDIADYLGNRFGTSIYMGNGNVLEVKERKERIEEIISMATCLGE